MATSVFQSLAQDMTVKIGSARDRDQNPKTRSGRLLSYDNFEKGFGGWADHYSGTPRNPMSLISDRALSGTRSLLMSTVSKEPFSGDWLHNSNGTFNRMSRDFNERYIDFSAFISVGGTDAMAVGAFYMSLDTQRWDNSQRAYFRVRSLPSTTTGFRTWAIGHQAVQGDPVTYLGVVGTGSGNGFPGYNENKLNSMYVRVTLDLEENTGRGGYVEAQFGDTVYNLASIGAIPEQQFPQYSPTDENQSFAGGFNPGFQIGNSIPGVNNNVVGEAWLIMDEVVVSARKEL